MSSFVCKRACGHVLSVIGRERNYSEWLSSPNQRGSGIVQRKGEIEREKACLRMEARGRKLNVKDAGKSNMGGGCMPICSHAGRQAAGLGVPRGARGKMRAGARGKTRGPRGGHGIGAEGRGIMSDRPGMKRRRRRRNEGRRRKGGGRRRREGGGGEGG